MTTFDITRKSHERFAEDILAIVSDRPVLMSDLLYALRHGYFERYSETPDGYVQSETVRVNRWTNVREGDVVEILETMGAHFRGRAHGAGWAYYVATSPFETVLYRGKSVPVRESTPCRW